MVVTLQGLSWQGETLQYGSAGSSQQLVRTQLYSPGFSQQWVRPPRFLQGYPSSWLDPNGFHRVYPSSWLDPHIILQVFPSSGLDPHVSCWVYPSSLLDPHAFLQSLSQQLVRSQRFSPVNREPGERGFRGSCPCENKERVCALSWQVGWGFQRAWSCGWRRKGKGVEQFWKGARRDNS